MTEETLLLHHLNSQYQDMESPLIHHLTPKRHSRNSTSSFCTTPKMGSRMLTPVHRLSRTANRNVTPISPSHTNRTTTPVFRITNAQGKRCTTPKHIMCTPVARISRVGHITPISRLTTSAKLLKQSCKRRMTPTPNIPAISLDLDSDSVFSPCSPMITSPCNREFLMTQERELRNAWKLSISDSPRSSLAENNSTPQRTQDAITVRKLLGSGGFGSVYIGTYKAQPVAVKYMRKQSKNCSAHFENFLAELRVMSLCHENILKTVAASDPKVYDAEAFLVMEYVEGNNLQQLIDDNDVTFSLQRCVKYGRQISSALAYCHKNNLVHLDIKPANILVNNDDDCKVADFGCCQFLELDNHTFYSALTGTYAYRAPELLRGERPTVKADIYALGVTLWQMESREKPYKDKDSHVIIFGVVAYNLRPHDDEPVDSEYSELYTICWNSDPQVRPSANDVDEQLQRIVASDSRSKIICDDIQ